jgi:hypothetical protein
MTTTQIPVEAIQITGVHGLDTIHVYWQNVEHGKGYVTITCFGAAWTAYFGSMNGKTIQQFFADVGVEYLVGKMGITPQLKSTKRDDAYLGKIIAAVKAALEVTV